MRITIKEFAALLERLRMAVDVLMVDKSVVPETNKQ